MLRLFLTIALVAVSAAPALAQPADGPPPETNLPLFAPLDLPTPNAIRTAGGAPGPDYWQNRADYRITASLDTTAHRVEGVVTLTYTNRSPDALPYLWLHLEQNLFRPDSRGSALAPPGSRWRGAFADGGYTLGAPAVEHDGRRYTAPPTVDDTRARVDLQEPLAPGDRLTLTIPYAFVAPEYGADRMGRFEARRGTVYEFAQWFPRIAVYDDVNGWNALPYLGQGEFYLDYGDYEAELTVPANMTVVATGALENPGDVYTPEQRRRVEQARQSAERVYIVGPDEVGTAAATPRQTGTATWRFRAENVRDVAWAASSAFILDGAGYRTSEGTDVLILSAYPHEGVSSDPANPGWERATEYSRHSIRHYSETWYPYPYPVAISVGGIVGGMEYPMIHFSSVEARHFGLFGVVDHELAHNWFPMIVGSDERRHAWMDEGFTSFMNHGSNLAYYDEWLAPGQPGQGLGDQTRWVQLAGSDTVATFFMREDYARTTPIMTYPDRIPSAGLGFLAYRKPAKGLLILRDHVLGPERLNAALRTYIRRWAYKHPQPADFFRTVEDVSGEDLDWLWRGWFMTTDLYDAAVTNVEPGDGATVITVENRAGLVFPVEVEVTFEGGPTERLRIPVEAFFQSDTARTGVAGNRRVTRVVLDPDRLLPDQDRANDVWPAASARGTR